jgi:hypothetical protein
MPRLVLAVATALLIAAAAPAQCPPWYPPYPVAPPTYPLTPAIWGAPFPKPLPPALPRAVPAVHEEDEPAVPAKPANKKDASKGNGDAKDKDTPRIPKMRLPFPGDRLDKSVPDAPKGDSPKTEARKKDEPAAKRFEQYVIPADGRGEPRAEVKVGFFNHSEREIVLDVNGEPLKLPSEQYVTLRLPRTFTWAETGAKGNSVVVAPDADGIEIVFRK